MSERTLSRRLADERTTYEELGDQLRRSLALQYIRAPSISVSQIAWLLGNEGSTLFSHAFARWTGRSPSAVRKDEKLPAPAERQKEIGEFGVAMPVPRAWSRHKPTPPARKVSAPSRGKTSPIDAQSTGCVVLLCVTLSVWSALGGRWNEEEGQ